MAEAKHTDEYFLEKFQASSIQGKCRSIYGNYTDYIKFQTMADKAKLAQRKEELDDKVELNFRLASKKIKLLTPEELTVYLSFIEDKMGKELSTEKNDRDMLNTRLRFSTIINQLPTNLTPEQEMLRDGMRQVLSNYFVKFENVM